MARARRSSGSDGGTVDAVVVGVDTYAWVDEDGNRQTADRGEKITVSADEFARIDGALAKAGSKQAKAVTGDTDDDTGATSPSGYPLDHESLDALAEKNDFSFDQHVRTPDEKIQALEQAGIRP